MNIYSLPAVISFTLNISVALIVLLEAPQKPLNRWFAAFVFSFGLWNFSEILILNSSVTESALFGAHILYRIIFLIPAFFVVITYLFPEGKGKYVGNLKFYFAIFLVPILLLLFSFPNFQINILPIEKNENIFYYKLTFNESSKFIALIIISFLYVVWGTAVLIKKYYSEKRIKIRSHISFLLFGSLTIFALYIVINLVRAYYESTLSYYLLSSIVAFVISLFFLFAVLRYKIINTGETPKTGLIYSITSTIVLFLYFLLSYELASLTLKLFNINSQIVLLSLILSFIILLRPFQHRIILLIDKKLHRELLSYRASFVRFSEGLQNYLPAENLFDKTADFIMENLGVVEVYTFKRLKSDDSFEYVDKGVTKQHSFDFFFLKKIKNSDKVIDYNEIKHISENCCEDDELNRLQIDLIIPIKLEGNVIALLLLANKRKRKHFSQDDIEALTILANEISIVLQRNKIMDDFAKEAKEKFNLEKLAALGKLTAGIAHEIRNPLNTISVSAQTLLKKKVDENYSKELLSYITEEVTRLERLLQDFLKLSRIKEPTFTEFELKKLVEKLLFSFQMKEKEEVDLKLEIEDETLMVIADFDFLFQIILNFLLNGYEAILQKCKDGNFECSDGKLFLSVFTGNSSVVFSVKDNGTGIDKENAEQILNPFFTTKEEGTGLGLSIAYNLVQTMDGELQFSSNENETEFKVLIPKERKK
jgi:signal transduction histidine kinase